MILTTLHTYTFFVIFDFFLSFFVVIVPKNQNSQKSPNLLVQPIRKYYYKTLGTNVIKSLVFPPSLVKLI